MQKIKFNHHRFQSDFNISMCSILPQNTHQIPFGASLGIILPGQKSKEHRHDELETFVIIQGTGSIECDGNKMNVGPGDIIHFAAFESHTLYNSGEDNLHFVSMYWRNQETSAASALKKIQKQSVERVYVTSTPPTPNGDLHLGHLSGPYLGADVYTRYLKMCGVQAYHISGSDDFQSYVVAKSKALRLTPEQIADRFANEIKTTLDAMNIVLDQFTRPLHSNEYQKDLALFIHNLCQNNIIYKKEESALFDSESGVYLYEVDVKGNCPHCDSRGCGNICEECGHSNSCIEMKDCLSVLSSTQPTVNTIKRLHFPLHQYEDRISQHHYHAIMGARLHVLFEQMRIKGLPEIAISHPGSWGVTVPINEMKDQTIWVWFEMAFSFLFSIREIEKRVGSAPKNLAIPSNSRVVHFFGYDNAFYHSILFPAIYLAAFPESQLKIDYAYNEFYLLDGLKFSTSREHAVWGKEILKEFSADEVRFYLSFTRPETSRMNFTKRDFRRVYKNELVQNWRKWLIDLDTRIKNNFAGKIPDTGSWTLEHRHFYGRLQQFIKSMSEAYEIATFSLQRASRILCELVRESMRFAQGEQHWYRAENCSQVYRTSIAIEVAAVRLLALLAAPLMPNFAETLWRQIGETDDIKKIGWPVAPQLAKPGAQVDLRDPSIGRNNH